MGTGSEPPQMLRLRKNAAGSVPVPFFHGGPGPEKGDRHRRQHELPLSYRSSTEPVPIFADRIRQQIRRQISPGDDPSRQIQYRPWSLGQFTKSRHAWQFSQIAKNVKPAYRDGGNAHEKRGRAELGATYSSPKVMNGLLMRGSSLAQSGSRLLACPAVLRVFDRPVAAQRRRFCEPAD